VKRSNLSELWLRAVSPQIISLWWGLGKDLSPQEMELACRTRQPLAPVARLDLAASGTSLCSNAVPLSNREFQEGIRSTPLESCDNSKPVSVG
jgi:hypothetical protein